MATGCSKSNKFRVAGTAKENPNKSIFLNKVDVNTLVFIDSVKTNSKGEFRFNVKAEMPDFYQLSLSQNDFVTLLAVPGEEINLRFPGKNLYSGYEVSGSPGTLKLKYLDSALAVTTRKVDSLVALYRKSLNDPDFKQKEPQFNSDYEKLIKDQRMFNIKFILENLNSFASIKALYQKIDENAYVLGETRDLQYMKLVSDTLSKYYPDSRQVKALKTDFERELNQSMVNRLNAVTSQIEPTKLDPTLKDISGKTISLSSLKGKYVLLSFWSAASNDCLAENLQLKEYYNKYRGKGFEIYQINLDANEELWRKAVKFDELPWINVREDDSINPKNAVLYNVRILPANYLYNKEGNIIGSNLHGKSLQLKLAQLFGD
jgi:thiol-disulfide isomerase/thioredoxin